MRQHIKIQCEMKTFVIDIFIQMKVNAKKCLIA